MTAAADIAALREPISPPIAELAHDFNNLLGIIIANLDLLAERQQASSEESRLIEEAMTAALRGSDLARGLMADMRRGSTGDEREPVVPPVAEVASATGKGELVLVVDDNAALRAAVARELQTLGYRTCEAGDGPEALMVLNREPVALLFTDVVMPGGLSGFDLARLVLARWPSMKALITSAFPDLEPSGDSITTGKLRRLIKPYRRQDLAVTLRQVLDGGIQPQSSP